MVAVVFINHRERSESVINNDNTSYPVSWRRRGTAHHRNNDELPANIAIIASSLARTLAAVAPIIKFNSFVFMLL